MKTQHLHISSLKTPSDFPVSLDGSNVSPFDNTSILGLNIKKQNFLGNPQITMIVKAASKKLEVLFRLREFFSSSQLFYLYRSLIHPCMDYCSHIWGGSRSTYLLNGVKSKATRLINCPALTNNLDSLSLRRDAGSLSLFYRYFNGQCSREHSTRIPPPLYSPRSTRLASFLRGAYQSQNGQTWCLLFSNNFCAMEFFTCCCIP